MVLFGSSVVLFRGKNITVSKLESVWFNFFVDNIRRKRKKCGELLDKACTY